MSKKIKQIFHHYEKWEDVKGGLYASNCERYEEKVKMSAELLSNQEEFFSVATEMFSKWPFSSEQNLTDSSLNRRAWIGQASCCFNHGAPDYATKEAWWSLDEHNRSEANKTADKALLEWEKKQIMKESLWEN